MIREDRGKSLFNFCSRPMVLLILDVIALMCLSNVNCASNLRPEYFCDET